MPQEVAISYGHGVDVKQWVQVDFIQHVTPPLRILEEYLHEPYLDIGLAKSWWDRSNETAYHLSTNLMVRSQSVHTQAGNIFIEAGFGPHLFSRPEKTKRLDTAFEFNSFAGLGLELNPEWSLVAKARHLSNAG
ncbi:MAG: acyloxyacyl hydrolase, partial [Ghiorsea sp.]|nr:acyloxyacyl hydrolase [Ghiorsea sp.]